MQLKKIQQVITDITGRDYKDFSADSVTLAVDPISQASAIKEAMVDNLELGSQLEIIATVAQSIEAAATLKRRIIYYFLTPLLRAQVKSIRER